MAETHRPVQVITDSTADLPAELVAKHNLELMHATVSFADQSFTDGVDIDSAALAKRISETGEIPSTAVPGKDPFVQLYRRHPDSHIVSVHPGRNLSVMIESAQLAAQMLTELHDPKVHAYDSGTVSLGLGFMAIEAAMLAQEGADMDTIVAHLDDMKPRLAAITTVDDLRFLEKSGRASKSQVLFGSMLNVKPILEVDNNRVDKIGQERGRKKSIRALFDFASGFGPLERLAVFHFGAQGEADNLATDLQVLHPKNDILTVGLGPIVATHGGPGTIGLALLRSK